MPSPAPRQAPPPAVGRVERGRRVGRGAGRRRGQPGRRHKPGLPVL